MTILQDDIDIFISRAQQKIGEVMWKVAEDSHESSVRMYDEDLIDDLMIAISIFSSCDHNLTLRQAEFIIHYMTGVGNLNDYPYFDFTNLSIKYNVILGTGSSVSNNGGGGGSGDMTKAVYDPNDDGKVTSASSADEASAAVSGSQLETDIVAARTGAVADVRAGVVTAGDTLAKLYTLIESLDTQKQDSSTLLGDLNTLLGGVDWQTDTNTQLTQEQVQDFVAPLLNHANHTNVSVSYDDVNNEIILTVSGGGGGGVSDLPLQANFDSDLDTISAQVTFKGAKTFSDLFFDSKLTGVTFEVKLASASTWTAQADLTALNSWVTSNVTTPSTLWQIRLIADFGANSGEADATLIYT